MVPLGVSRVIIPATVALFSADLAKSGLMESEVLGDFAAGVPNLAQSWNRSGCDPNPAAARLGCEPCDEGWDSWSTGWIGLVCNQPGGRVYAIDSAHMGVATVNISGDVSGWAAVSELRNLSLRGTAVKGNISGWTTMVFLERVNLAGTGVTGNVSGWTTMTSARTINLYRTKVWGDVSGWMDAMPYAGARAINLQDTRVTLGGSSGWSGFDTRDAIYQRNRTTSASPDTLGLVNCLPRIYQCTDTTYCV